jgi:hypothetical protein
MTFGTRQDGTGYLELSKAEVELLKARKPVVKRGAYAKGHFKITVKMTQPRSKEARFRGL